MGDAPIVALSSNSLISLCERSIKPQKTAKSCPIFGKTCSTGLATAHLHRDVVVMAGLFKHEQTTIQAVIGGTRAVELQR